MNLIYLNYDGWIESSRFLLKKSRENFSLPLVPMTGLEPVRLLGSRDFKSLASAYFATSA